MWCTASGSTYREPRAWARIFNRLLRTAKGATRTGRWQIVDMAINSRQLDGDAGYGNSVNAHEGIPGSALITVEQFGYLLWWGDGE